MTAIPDEIKIAHITVKTEGDRIDAHCDVCKLGINVGAHFGIIPGEVMLAEWLKQHTHNSKAKRR